MTNKSIGNKKTTMVNREAYEMGDLRTLISDEKDMPWHREGVEKESWYIVANLESNGQRLGLQVHSLLSEMPNGEAIVSITASVLNESTGWYRDFEYFAPASQVSVSKTEFDINTPQFRFYGDVASIQVYAEIPDATIDIVAKNVNPTLLANGEGYVDFLGVKQYDYAFTAMETTGTITIENAPFEVKGSSWFDRQWGDIPEYLKGAGNGKTAADMQWIWTNPQLDNGVNMSAGQITLFDSKKILHMLTIVEPDGTHIITSIEPIEKSEYWLSPKTGNKYPTKLALKAPAQGISLEIEIPYKQQEIIRKSGSYYEGAAKVTGTYKGTVVTGVCYCEYVGNWK